MDRASLDEAARGELVAWLGDQLADERFAQLDRAGHDPNDRIPLARVLVDVPIARSPLAEKKDDAGTKDVLAALCQEEPELFQRLASSPQLGARDQLEIEDMVDRGVDEACATGGTSGIVLIGGPGQGKSTITQSLCALHHTAWLSPHTDHLNDPASEAVDSIRAAQQRMPTTEMRQGSESTGRHGDFQSSAPPLPVPATLRFPLRIVLPEAAAWLHARKGASREMLPSLLFFAAERAAKVPVSVATLGAILGEVDWLLILDGLDEVPASEARSAVISAARALIDWLRERRPSGLIVATTRPQGYGGELDRWAELQTWYLLPLGVDDARKYAGHLVRARYDGKRGERILTRLSEAAASAATARLLRTPLQTTILVALIARIGRAPGERWSLFSEYYRIIYEREMERDLPAAELLRRYRPFIDRIHAHVGLLLQVESELADGTDATMTPARLRDVMHAVFAEQGMDAARRQPIIDELLTAITERLVLLVERRVGHVGFEIRPLQEMMAAWALGQKESLIGERLLTIAKSDAHREVVLFLASKAFAELSDVREVLVDRVLPALNEDPEEPLAAHALRGSVLAIYMLQDGAALSQPKYVERLVGFALLILELPPTEEIARLAKACTADADGASVAVPIVVQAIRSKLDAGLPLAEILSAWCLLIALTDLGAREAKTLADGRFGEIETSLNAVVHAAKAALREGSTWLTDITRNRTHELDAGAFLFLRSKQERALIGRHQTNRFAMKGVRIGIGVPDSPQLCGLRWPSIDQPHKEWNSIAAFALPHPSLLPMIAAARFILAPTAESLAMGLQLIADASDWRVAKATPGELPWPLAACMSMADTAEDLRILSRRARDGELGDTASWRAAEARCQRSGLVELADLYSNSSDNWPQKGSLDQALLPLAAAKTAFRQVHDIEPSQQGDREILLAIERLHRNDISEHRKSLMAKAVVNYLLQSASQLRRFPLAVKDARALWLLLYDFPLQVLDPMLLRHELLQQQAKEPWLNFLDEIGRSGRFRGSEMTIEHLRDFVVAGLNEHPEMGGLLRLFEKTWAEAVARTLPDHLLIADRYPKAGDGEWVFLLRFVRGDVSLAEVEAELPALVDATRREAVFRGRLYYTFMLRSNDVAMQSAYLRATLSQLPLAERFKYKDIVTDARSVLGETPTGLDDPGVWDTLQLPMPRPERRSVSDRAPESPVERRPIVIDELSLRNFRGIEELQLKPSPPENGHGQWIILLGQNGLGKTTLLRALVLSLFDLENAVRRPLPPTAYNSAWRRIGASLDDPAFVRLRLRGKELEHGVDLRPRDDLLWREYLRPAAAPPVEEMVFAYGVRRRYLVSDLSRAVGPELHALVPSLFEEGADLVPIEESLSPLEAAWHTDPESVEGRIHVELREALKELLHVDTIERRGQDLWVRGENIGEVPLKELSDGYLTLASWVVDLVIRWWNQAKRWKWRVDPAKPILESMTGLVLIDEIDLFLHPNWQRSVVKTLKKLLPRMSFVVTTHNPLAILGARANEIWILRRGEGSSIVAEQRDQEPFRLTGSDLYDLFFGIESTLPDEIGQMLYRYRQLASDPYRSPEEDAEAKKLLANLRERDMDPGYEPMPVEDVPPLPEALR